MSASDDYELLRRYEPVLVFSPDERFFPLAVEDFIRHSRLWSVPFKLGSLTFRRRWKQFKPAKDLTGSLAQMSSDEARNGFVYLEFVGRFARSALLWQTWPLVAIEIGLALLPFGMLVRAVFELSGRPTFGSLPVRGPDILTNLFISVPLALALGGTIVALLKLALRWPDAYADLPQARLRSFQTLVTLGLVSAAIIGLLTVGPLAVMRHGLVPLTAILWGLAWLAALLLIGYVPQFFRTGILQLSSIFAILSGLNDATGDESFKKLEMVETEKSQPTDERLYPYYGRVWPADPEVRDSYQYVALQYWFFYAFNDWRTRYNGIDDHEGDWEHVTVILSREEYGTELTPTYLVYSQHILPGAYLRRAWDDPGVEKVQIGQNEHPVAYVAAGSHAHYYRQDRHGLDELLRANKLAEGVYGNLLRSQEKVRADRTPPGTQRTDVDIRVARPIDLNFLGNYLLTWSKGSIPQLERMDVEEFVDYAAVSFSDPFSKQTGPSIGPGQLDEWSPVVIAEDAPEWMRFNGNWGRYVAYFGERAPRGPRFASKVANREEWTNPIEAAGLITESLEPPFGPQP